MDILNKLVIPQSAQHIHILHYLLTLSLFLFIPFIGLILGGATLAYFYKNIAQKKDNHFYLRFAKDIIDTVTVSKAVGIALGIIPLLTIILILIQLLHEMPIPTISYLLVAFVFICIALVLIYTFKYTFTFSDIYDSIKDIHPVSETVHKEIESFKEGNKNLGSNTAIYGLILLYAAFWVIVAALSYIVFRSDFADKGLFSVLFSWEVLSRFIYMLAASFMFTGAAILFNFFYWDGGKKIENSEYKEFVKNHSTRITLIPAVILPLFLLINLLGIPNDALSSVVFGFAFIALLLVFWVYHLLYHLIKEPTSKFSGMLFFVALCSILAILVKDQVTIANATELQTELMSANYDQFVSKLEASEKPAKKISGEEIFNNICSSCHAFDHKIVGPPYNQTLPTFEGKMDDLVSFILNPVPGKVPGYPPMPNPGLNPAQAKAVAQYIMTTYKNEKK